MNKRGVSPLVATLILIMFSIALGTLVMNWGKAYIEQRAEFVLGANTQPVSCDTVSVGIIKVGGQQQVCVDPVSSMLRVDIENGALSIVDNLQLRIVGSQEVLTVEKALPSQLAKGAAATIRYQYAAADMIKQVKLIPYMAVNELPRLCTEKSIVVDGPIRSC